MPKKIAIFLISEFLQLFLPIFFSLIFIGTAYRLSTIGDTEQVYISLKNILLVFLYVIPQIFSIVLILATLFSLTLMCIKLRLTGEFIAFFCSKISPARLFNVLFAFSGILTIIGLLNNLYLKPYAAFKLQKIAHTNSFEQIKNLKPMTFKRIAKNSFVYAASKNRTLKNVLYYRGNFEKGAVTAISAKEMALQGPHSFFQTTFIHGSLVTIQRENATISHFGNLSINPFKDREIDRLSPKIIPSKALYHMVLSDNEAYTEAVELSERFFLPCSLIIILFTGFTLTVSCRKDNHIFAIICAFFSGILFFAIYFIFYSLGKKGGINPLFSFLTLFFIELLVSIVAFKTKFKKVF